MKSYQGDARSRHVHEERARQFRIGAIAASLVIASFYAGLTVSGLIDTLEACSHAF